MVAQRVCVQVPTEKNLAKGLQCYCNALTFQGSGATGVWYGGVRANGNDLYYFHLKAPGRANVIGRALALDGDFGGSDSCPRIHCGFFQIGFVKAVSFYIYVPRYVDCCLENVTRASHASGPFYS
jgi:hypothetical protein